LIAYLECVLQLSRVLERVERHDAVVVISSGHQHGGILRIWCKGWSGSGQRQECGGVTACLVLEVVVVI
jgi:hypothetical protein